MSKLLKSIILTSTIAFTANALATAEAANSASNVVDEAKPAIASEETQAAPTANEQKKHNEKHKKKHKGKKKHKEHKHEHKDEHKDDHKHHEDGYTHAPAASAAPTASAVSEE